MLAARELGDQLIVLLNSDEWLSRKKGRPFMNFFERKMVLENLWFVDYVLDFDDSDNSAVDGLEKVVSMYKQKDDLYFCNGGDRNKNNIPEMELDDIDFLFSVGGDDKKNSSSWILKKWSYPYTKRLWGDFYDLFSDDYVKVKELIVFPKEGMSFQRHFKRNELWYVTQGKCDVNYSHQDPDNVLTIQLQKGDRFDVPVSSWHQITNPFDQPCHLIEIQYGQEVAEEDKDRAFNNQKPIKKIFILFAGPAANFIFSIIAYTLMFSAGVPGQKPIIGKVDQQSIAWEANIRAGDEIISVGDRDVKTWQSALISMIGEVLLSLIHISEPTRPY